MGDSRKAGYEAEQEAAKELFSANILNSMFSETAIDALRDKARNDFAEAASSLKGSDDEARRQAYKELRLKTISLDLRVEIEAMFSVVNPELGVKAIAPNGRPYECLELRGRVGDEQDLYDAIVAQVRVLKHGKSFRKTSTEESKDFVRCDYLYWRLYPTYTEYEGFVVVRTWLLACDRPERRLGLKERRLPKPDRRGRESA